MLCDFMSMTFWKRQNFTNRKQISGCQGIERPQGEAREQRAKENGGFGARIELF